MNTLQLWYALSSNFITSRHFKGIFARDQVPKILQPNDFIVCNTDSSKGPGEHWVVWYRRKNGLYEFFDSLGNNPTFYWKKVPFSYYSLKKLSKRIQELNTDICGEMCLYYIYLVLRGHELTDVTFLMPYSQNISNILCKIYSIICCDSHINENNNQICKYF